MAGSGEGSTVSARAYLAGHSLAEAVKLGRRCEFTREGAGAGTLHLPGVGAPQSVGCSSRALQLQLLIFFTFQITCTAMLISRGS